MFFVHCSAGNPKRKSLSCWRLPTKALVAQEQRVDNLYLDAQQSAGKRLGTVGYNLLLNGVYWGYNRFTAVTFYELPLTSKWVTSVTLRMLPLWATATASHCYLLLLGPGSTKTSCIPQTLINRARLLGYKRFIKICQVGPKVYRLAEGRNNITVTSMVFPKRTIG